MALVHVGSVNSGDTGADGSDATVDLSGLSLQEGDVVLGVSSFKGTSDLLMAMTTADYTTLADLYADGTNDTNLGVFRKVMGATPDASAVFANPGSGAGDHLSALVDVWRGGDTTAPEDATSVTATAIGSAIPNPGAITKIGRAHV